jgi:hypothetical protein
VKGDLRGDVTNRWIFINQRISGGFAMNNENRLTMEGLKSKLSTSIKEHSSKCRLDSFFYNGGTVAVLLATTTATFLPENLGAWSWVPKALTAFATFLVTLERILRFGERWRFHLEMKNEFQIIEDKIDLHDQLNQDKKEEYLQSINQELMILRRRETGIPIGEVRITKKEGTATEP